MSAIRYVQLVGLFFLGYYAIALVASSFLFSDGQDKSLDTENSQQTIFSTPAAYAVYHHEMLSRPGPKYIILGGSPALLGLRPPQMSKLLGGAPVHNLSLNAPDMSELFQELRVLCLDIPPERLRETVFVVGIDYLQFVDGRRRWENGPTDIDNEVARYGLFVIGSDGTPRRRFGMLPTRVLVYLLRPIMMLGHVYDRYAVPVLDEIRVGARRAGGDPVFEFEIHDGGGGQRAMSARDRQTSLALWTNYMGPEPAVSTGQLGTLEDVARYASHVGARLLVVDLPLPAWQRRSLPYDREYTQRKIAYLSASVALPGVRYADLTRADSADDFSELCSSNRQYRTEMGEIRRGKADVAVAWRGHCDAAARDGRVARRAAEMSGARGKNAMQTPNLISPSGKARARPARCLAGTREVSREEHRTPYARRHARVR